jgi:hypothetical protein
MEPRKFNFEKTSWLWLEDEPATVSDVLTSVFEKLNLKLRKFTSIGELMDYLIQIRGKDPSELLNIGLILDIMIKGAYFVSVPNEWSHGSSINHYKTNMGYDAGIIFYEKVILNLDGIKSTDKAPYWNPPPPVIFLTVLAKEKISDEINIIKNKWAHYNNVVQSESKVEYLDKWSVDEILIRELINFWNK